MWRSEDTFVELGFSVSLYVGLRTNLYPLSNHTQPFKKCLFMWVYVHAHVSVVYMCVPMEALLLLWVTCGQALPPKGKMNKINWERCWVQTVKPVLSLKWGKRTIYHLMHMYDSICACLKLWNVWPAQMQIILCNRLSVNQGKDSFLPLGISSSLCLDSGLLSCRMLRAGPIL